MPDAVASWALRFTYAGLLISQNFGRSQAVLIQHRLGPTTGGLGLVYFTRAGAGLANRLTVCHPFTVTSAFGNPCFVALIHGRSLDRCVLVLH